MTISPDHLSAPEREALLAALAWQVELGADECIAEGPFDRFTEAATAPTVLAAPLPSTPLPSTMPGQSQAQTAGPAGSTPMLRAAPPMGGPSEGERASHAIAAARSAAAAAQSLDELRSAMEAFEGCALKKGAKATVFADGNPAARVMIIGEAPGAEEDARGLPFVGRSGQLLDRMLAAIGLSRKAEDPATAVYITNTIPWRPVGNRDPAPEESEMMWAFLERHIQLAAPEFIMTMGRISASTLMEDQVRITRIHGQ